VGLTSRQPGKESQQTLDAVGDSLSDLSGSDDEDNGGDDDDTEQSELSEDDEPGGVMGTISKRVQKHIERFWQMQMELDQLTHLGWWDAASYIRESEEELSTTELKVSAKVKPHAHKNKATPERSTFGELMVAADIIPGISLKLQAMSRLGSCHMRPRSGRPQSNKGLASVHLTWSPKCH